MVVNRRLVESKLNPDFYPTPRWATKALIDHEPFEGSIWEPACGNGWMADELKLVYPSVHASDLFDRGYGETGLDFLSIDDDDRVVDNIITNPPYNVAEKFIHKAICYANKKVCMLLRLAFLEGQSRWQQLYSFMPPSKILIFSERITFYPDGVQTAGSGTTAYGWFIWDKSQMRDEYTTKLEWIRPGYKTKS